MIRPSAVLELSTPWKRQRCARQNLAVMVRPALVSRPAAVEIEPCGPQLLPVERQPAEEPSPVQVLAVDDDRPGGRADRGRWRVVPGIVAIRANDPIQPMQGGIAVRANNQDGCRKGAGRLGQDCDQIAAVGYLERAHRLRVCRSLAPQAPAYQR